MTTSFAGSVAVFLLCFASIPAASAQSGQKHLIAGAGKPAPLLIHGNYCGPGSRPGSRPIDALDAACQRHDSCVHPGKVPSCACNARLQHDAEAIAQNPRQPPDIQFIASATAAAAGLLICH